MRTFLLAFLITIALEVQAQVTVEKMFHTFTPESAPVTNVMVYNDDENSAVLVAAQVLKVLPKEGGDEKTEETEELLVSPKRFSIPAKGERAVRLVLRTKPTDIEAAYRVNFLPQVEEGSEDPKAKKAIMLTVLTGMGMLIFAEPKDPQPGLSWEAKGASQLLLRNSGNLNVQVLEVSECFTAENCGDLGLVKRLYPKESLDLPWRGAGSSLKLKMVVREDTREIEITSASGSW